MDVDKVEPETPSIASAMAKTTTISTIAVQSGKTRIVIALLHCGNWLQLKILEITPELTKLGATLAEALELQKAHDEVLRQLQNKQSPVEELLRQADQLIATQKPRAEVYAAMAETLGRAWRDINFNLELRKDILDLNVHYHTKASEFFDKIKALEESCTDTVVPIEIQAVKQFLTTIHDLRRTLLESLMAALQAGNSLLGKLKELGAEGTLDSRPDHIRQSLKRALSQVQSWLDELHVKRQDVEGTFTRRKSQLEQCLALAILAADLRELEESVTNSRNHLANAKQLGDSMSSAELLQYENKRLLPEAQILQEKALKITKATEQLLESGCFAGEEATKQSYTVLSLTSDYLNEIQKRNSLLEKVVSFFRSAQSAFNKLDQLQDQLTTSNLKSTSPQLAQLHAQCSAAIEDITNGPIADGYTIIDIANSESADCEGVKRTVEELENMKIKLNSLCIAHREENMRINKALENFFDAYSSIQIWLTTIAEAFLQAHQNMGNDSAMATDFMDLHRKLLTDLQDKGNEINALLLTLPPILEYLDDDKRKDIDAKVEELHEKWMNLKNILENRLDLGRIYVKFHTEADIVNREIDKLENELRAKGQDIDDDTLKNLEFKWESLEPLYQSAKNTGLTFISDARKVSEPYLDTNRACVCVETVLEKLAGRQLQVTRNWQTFYAEVVEKKETLVRLEETMVESTKTINWVTKLEAQLYPVITISSTDPKEISSFVQSKLDTVLPDIKRAQNEIEQKIKTAETLIAKARSTDEKTLNIKNKLCELNKKLLEIATDYQTLLQAILSYLNTLNDLDKALERNYIQTQDISSINDINRIRFLLSEHEASKQNMSEMFRFANANCQDLVQRILKQEPISAANNDIEKLRHILEFKENTWKHKCAQKQDILDTQYTLCQFDDDLKSINNSINNLEQQNQELKSRYGKSLEEARASSIAYSSFEKTIQDLNDKIENFIKYGQQLMSELREQSPLIQKHIIELQERWNNLKNHIQETRRLIDLSIQYFQLVQDADEWFKEGNRLLVSIARRSTLVKTTKEAEDLLKEISTFLKPGEEKQNDRIKQITHLAELIYGVPFSDQLTQVVDDNREMMKSFTNIKEEIDILTRNLIRAEEEKLRQQKEREETAKRLAAARAEIEAAEEAKAALEKKRREIEEATRQAQEGALEKQRMSAIAAENERRAAEENIRILREEALIQKREIESKTHIIQLQHEHLNNFTQAKLDTKQDNELLEAPIFVTPLADAVIQEGSRFSFICQVTGTPTPIITWYKDGIPIHNNPDYKTTFSHGICTLTIEETFSDDSAKYTCKATNSAGATETSAALSVKESEPQEQLIPPSFSKLLEPANVKEGSAFQFHCIVEGNPLPNVQWYKNQDCIDYAPGYNITYNNGEAILRFDCIELKDKSEYTCKATNQLGSAQSTASLSVSPSLPKKAPHIISPLSNVMARAGQKIKLECEITGLPVPDLVWTQNGHPIKETFELKLHREVDKATLVICEAFPKDAGTYKITATNIAGEASSSCSVFVKGRLPNETSDSEIASDMEPVKPSIQLPLFNTNVDEGSKIQLDCVIIGQPEPEVIWYHDNRPVKESTDVQLLFQGDRCSLIIQEALAEDGGEYKVVALNSAGEASSKCNLYVKPKPSTIADSNKEMERTILTSYPPKFNKLLSDILVSEGEKVIFECNVSGQPRPEVKWLLNNMPIVIDDHLKVIHDEDDNIRLEINEVRPEDKGVYTVKAKNEHGEAKCFSQLIVKSSKPAETVKYEEVKYAPIFVESFSDKMAFENTSVKFECIVNGKPKPKVKWLFKGQSITGNNNFLPSTSGDRQVISIPNITKDTEGNISCVAENEMGKSTCSASITVLPLSTISLPEAQPFQSLNSSLSVKREIHTESSTTMSSKVISSSIDAPKAQTKIHSFSSHDQKTVKQLNQGTPEISESHSVEEYLDLGNKEPIIHEKSTSAFSTEKPQPKVLTIQHSLLQKPIIKSRAPKFMTPVIGKIVDQNTTVVLEGIVDGSPSPKVTWSKNGKEIIPSDRIIIKWEFNKASVEIKDTNTSDGGRYTCTAINEAGTAISTADLVIRKTIFPPVFGRRLQAQVIKKGDRIIMEVEITGTPEPTVTWFKDSIPIEQVLSSNYKIKTFGNSHTLVIDKADIKHSGRFMVRAVNSGGEAQSIADIAVFEPTPDTMVEVVKTVVFEDIRKHETLTSAADNISSTVESKSEQNFSVNLPKTSMQTETHISESKFSGTSESQSSSFSEQKISKGIVCGFDNKISDIPKPKQYQIENLQKQTDFEIVGIPTGPDLSSENETETGIVTDSITKESSLQYFVKKMEESNECNITPLPPPKIENYRKFESITSGTLQKVEDKPTITPSIPIISNEELRVGKSDSHEIHQIFELTPEPPATICFSESTPVLTDNEYKEEKILDERKISEKQEDIFIPIYHSEYTKYSTEKKSTATPEKFPFPHKFSEIPSETKETSLAHTYDVGHTNLFVDTKFEKQTRAVSPRPEAIEMEKLWIPKREVDKTVESFSHEKSVAYHEQSSITGKEIVTETPRIHYIANVSHCIQPCENKIEDLLSKSDRIEEFRESCTRTEFRSEQHGATLSESSKFQPLRPETKPYPPMESLTIRPVSVQDITDEFVLQPGPPPIIDYAQPPKIRRQSYVETVEHELESKIECEPAKVPPGGVRTIPPPPPPKIQPPPLPPKKEQPSAPPIPAKPLKKEMTKTIIVIEPEKFPDLEPFPFKPDAAKPKLMKTGPPPTPSKFVKGKFTDSDYESDFESAKIPPKWKPCASDNEEPTYRKVKAPKLKDTKRSKSTEPEPLPPSKFDRPPNFQGPPRPEIKIEHQKQKIHAHKLDKIEKHSLDAKAIISPAIKPGTPPLYVEISPQKIDSPKIKRKSFIDGYTADTDEPFFQSKTNKLETHESGTNYSRYQCKSENIIESSRTFISNAPSLHRPVRPKKDATYMPETKKELTATPIITSVSTERKDEKYERQSKFEQVSHVQQQFKENTVKCPPPPSPSKFVKGEFRESDYESDLDKKIPKIWKPNGSDASPNYRPIRPVLTPTARQVAFGRTPTPPTEFEAPPTTGGILRPKFEPIDKPKIMFSSGQKATEIKTVVHKPKPISANQTDITKYIPLRPGTPPEITYTPGPKATQIYRSTTSMPYHNAIQTETSNKVHFKESSEKCHRTVSVEQSTKVIKFGDKQKGVRVPPPTTPKKFVPGEFRESDYESEVENIKIKPKWVPYGRDSEELHYRPVRPPSSASRASSVPPTNDYVISPMEFDQKASYKSVDIKDFGVKEHESRSYDQYSLNKTNFMSRSRSYEPPVTKMEIQPGAPPEYGYIQDPNFKSKARTIASQHMNNMTQEFKSKTHKFVKDIMNDVGQQTTPKKSILKNGDEHDAQIYREESRAAQYGTKHVDPDTGLIYFKYDFGYEFGIILPGESKNGGIPVPPKTVIDTPKRTKDIEMPVYHETSKNQSQNINKNFKPKVPKKNLKWEPTSESELSEYEGNTNRNIQGLRWEPSSCSPVSLSPSLPSTSPAFNCSFTGPDKNKVTDTSPSYLDTPVNAQKILPGHVRAPMFITPLRNIAVVSGQNAKFECIVQSEPLPNVLWSKNGRIIENCDDYQLHFRNGVCRLTISNAYPEDAGTYTCTATNSAGTASTTAILDVPGEIKSTYLK